ncbi:hypothetical protein PTSG_04892 [Salpingoeca rosetta]|uniref:Lon N-terminal domain-containing protein n=1 Tax=Salpingoeca rosetta (strain ATCC 50818 / BSB-021) TaxID=946362 RepID=F2U8X6_SALR5|nr:uncharacterized protein PTSG_04892 [Salpingoeca rosetta]EGD73179.1 hypothetical protein PTSG_04892 [Salpingoeca rosetta]|eukprot:XP_004994210.1 hypothetical protein PTSG_04892 [Salpingoeca rosetta]
MALPAASRAAMQMARSGATRRGVGLRALVLGRLCSSSATSASTGDLSFRSTDIMKPTRMVPLFPTSDVYFPGEVATIHVVEPKYKLMMQSLDQERPVIGFVRQPSAVQHEEEDSEHMPLSTDWYSATVGTLAEVVAHERDNTAPLDIDVEDTSELVKLRFTERFSVTDASRAFVGYWQGTVQRLTDEPVTKEDLKQADVLSRTVSALLNEYAKLALVNNPRLFNRFQMRHAAVATKGVAPFSFWVALQIKAALPSTEESKATCQQLLQTTSVVARLEHASTLLTDIITAEARAQKTAPLTSDPEPADRAKFNNPLGQLRTHGHEDM